MNDVPYRGDCGKCGATRIDHQIGLEPTPDAYVARMVAVFREVRRVLRSDGTCWVNLGDSYNASPGQRKPNDAHGPKQGTNVGSNGTGSRNVPGLKPKDLVGIPWLVAKALQAPYYTGKIKSEADRIWLAAMIDAEGCMFIHRRKEGMSNGQGYVRKADSFSAGLEVANVHESIIQRCMAITGLGSVCTQSPNENHRRVQTIYRWNLRSNVCRDVIREVYPYLVAKQHEARILLGCPSSGPKADAAHIALKALHNGEPTDVDFPPPASMYEPGWYLRSDCIWQKPNPMPESVTDRPTRSHEYLFLLTKSARYWYDADAIREPHTGPPVEHFGTVTSPERRELPAGVRGSIVQPRPREYNPLGRNRRTVWTIATEPFPSAHFATFPTALVEPCILAGCPEKTCPLCGAPYERKVERGESRFTERLARGEPTRHGLNGAAASGASNVGAYAVESTTVGWEPSCDCGNCPERKDGRHEWIDGADICARCGCDWEHRLLEPVLGVVLDPFAGSGTTLLVALRHGRRALGIELNGRYVELASRRIFLDCPMFNSPEAAS